MSNKNVIQLSDHFDYKRLLRYSLINLDNHPQVILMTPPQCYVDPQIDKVGFDIDAETIDNQIVDIVKQVAKDNGLHIIDLHQHTHNENG